MALRRAAIAAVTPSGDRASGGTRAIRWMRAGEFWTATWPSTSPPSTVALSTTASAVAGSTRPTAPSVRSATSSAVSPAAGDLGEPDEHQVAERVPLELTRGEAVVERSCPRDLDLGGAVGSQRDQALAEITDAEHAEVPPQPSGGTAVVGDAHDCGDVAGVAACGAQCRGEAVPAADRDDGRAGRASHGRRPGAGGAGGSRARRGLRRAPRPSRRCDAGRRCSRPRSTGTPSPPARTRAA